VSLAVFCFLRSRIDRQEIRIGRISLRFRHRFCPGPRVPGNAALHRTSPAIPLRRTPAAPPPGLVRPRACVFRCGRKIMTVGSGEAHYRAKIIQMPPGPLWIRCDDPSGGSGLRSWTGSTSATRFHGRASDGDPGTIREWAFFEHFGRSSRPKNRLPADPREDPALWADGGCRLSGLYPRRPGRCRRIEQSSGREFRDGQCGPA